MFRLLLAASALLPSQVQAQTCIPRREFALAITAAAPTVVDRLTERCSSLGGASPYLRREGRQLSERLGLLTEAERHQAWEALRISSLIGSRVPTDLGQTASALDRVVMALMPRLTTTECGVIDDLLESLSPLSPQQFGRAVAGMLLLMPAPGRPAICAEAGPTS